MKNETVLDWAKELRSWEESNEGKICKTGEIEIAEIAKRLRERLYMDNRKEGEFIVENTFKKRTQQTRDIFMKNLIPENYPKDQIHYREANHCEDIIGTDGAVNRTVFDRYAPLRFFSVCPVGFPVSPISRTTNCTRKTRRRPGKWRPRWPRTRNG